MLYSQCNHIEEKMIKRESGFTLVELLITMAIFVLTIAAASGIFVPLLTQFKQQSKIAETQIHGLAGLDMLRRDMEQAGFGLPWVIPESISYQEASNSTTAPIPAPNTYNDCSGSSPCNPPRAILSDNNVAGLGGSDYLVIKSTSVATNDAAMKWTQVVKTAAGNSVRVWGWNIEDLNTGDRVIVMIPSRGFTNQRILVNDGASYFVQFDAPSFPGQFSPATENDLYLIYGVDPDTALRMPFNRADYYIRRVAGTNIPQSCAPGTGVLMKSVINHADGQRGPGIPLLDCVADMQVIYGFDNDGDGDFEPSVGGSTDNYGDDITGLTAQEIREQVKEVRVYILAHEGQRDTTYTYPDSTINLGGDVGFNNPYDLSANITNWQNYRWKLHTLVVKPNNLR
jgi:prepilin-type N-terminal cleavage/methylation domain-containing protein